MKLVIIGAGAGLTFANHMIRNVKDDSIKLILIDKNEYIQLRYKIHLVALGIRNADSCKMPIKLTIENERIQFIKSLVTEVKPLENKLCLESGEIDYDYLIVAIGASTNYYGIVGAENYSLPFRDTDDAIVISRRIRQLINSNGKHNIVIVGAGPTGLTIAGTISDTLNSYPENKINIIVVEAKSRILPNLSQQLSDKTYDLITKKGVKIKTNSYISSLEKTHVNTNNNKFSSSLTIWTAGIKGSLLKATPELDKTIDGRILVNDQCRTIRYSNIFAIGDIAAKSMTNDKFYPQLSQIATAQAKYLAKILLKEIKYNKHYDNDNFDYSIKAFILSLGINKYIIELKDHIIYGDITNLYEDISKTFPNDEEVLDIIYDLFKEKNNRLNLLLKKISHQLLE